MNVDEPKDFRFRRLQKGVALLPNLLTACALFSGFYSIIYVLSTVIERGQIFKPAVFAILVATFFDSLDGRMARFMKAESEFGSHFDSIADMVSFGVAPAVLVYGSSLSHFGRLGWLASFLFLACAAIRLARFNVLSKEAPSRKYFKGMSSPVAAGGLSLFTLVVHQSNIDFIVEWGVFIMTLLLGLLMVSNVRFRSFKDMQVGRQPLQAFLITVVLILLVVTFQESALFLIFIVYLLSGFIEEFILWRRRRKSDPSVPFLPFGDR